MRGILIFLLIALIALFLFLSFQYVVGKSFSSEKKSGKKVFQKYDVRREQEEKIEDLKRRQKDLIEQRQRDLRMRSRF